MSNRLAIILIFGAGMLAVSCRSEPEPDPIPESLPGSYGYVANGSLGGKVSWQIAANLDLRPDGTFALTLDHTMNGKKESTESTHGKYTVSGDKLWITQSRDERGYRGNERHSLLIRPDSLVGEIGWKDHLVLRGIGIPDPVFVKRGQI